MIVYPTGKVRIHLFGRAHLSDGSAALKFKAPQRAFSLLAYLLLYSDTALSRDAVAFALWPDHTETDARADLRRHLYYLMNDALPAAPDAAPWILSDKRTVQWNPEAPAWCDLTAFRQCTADPAGAADAVELYRGELLEGFEDEWLLEHRDRFRERQVELLLNLMAATREQRNFNDAIAYTKKLLAVDPWREDGIRALIALRHAGGDRAGALSTYQDFAKRLEDELGVAPMAETTAEYRRVASAGEPQLAAPAVYTRPETIVGTEAVRSTPSFTGREEELLAIDSALWSDRKIAIVHGLGGIGKSAIAREYARRNRDRYSVIWALNAEDEGGIIEGLVRLGSQLVPDLEKASDRRAAAAHVIANELDGFDKPALLIFDNVHDERLLREWTAPAAHIIVTSPYSAWSGEAAPIWLDKWRIEETVNYLCREIGRADIREVEAKEIARRLECFPLAVAHAAAYLRATPNVTARRYLDRIGDHLAIAPRGADYQQAVLATFCEAIVKAEEEAPGAAALLVLSSFLAPDAIAEELFAQPHEIYATDLRPRLGTETPALDLRACISNAARTDDALGALHRFSLLVFSPETRSYRMHTLVQQAARAFAGSDRQPWVQSAIAAVESAFPPVDFATWRLCERLLSHGRAALASLDTGSGFAPAARLANACGNYLAKRAAFLDSEKLLRLGLGIAERSKQERDPHVAANLNALAKLLRDTNRHAEAANLHRRALEIYENELGSDHPLVEAVLNEIAELLNGSSDTKSEAANAA